jgi:hypothetical protein
LPVSISIEEGGLLRKPDPKIIFGAAMLIVANFAAVVCASINQAAAEDYPVRPITLIVPYPPGGGADAMGRIIAQKLSPALGQQVIIENSQMSFLCRRLCSCLRR